MRASWSVGLLLPMLLACEDARNAGRKPVIELHPTGPDAPMTAAISISADEYRSALARLRMTRDETLQAKPIPDSLRDYLVDRMIRDRLLTAEAERLEVRVSTTAVERELMAMRGALPPGEFDKLLIKNYTTEDDLRRALTAQLMGREALMRRTARDSEVDEEELRRAWEELDTTERRRPARVHAAQIVVRTEDQAKTIQAQLARGADFGALARKYSIAPEAAQGGDLGWFEKGVMPKVFDEVCFELEASKTSPIVPSEYGFHIFRVAAHEAARALVFEEYRDRLKRELGEEKMRQAEEVFWKRLLASVRVVTHEERLQGVR